MKRHLILFIMIFACNNIRGQIRVHETECYSDFGLSKVECLSFDDNFVSRMSAYAIDMGTKRMYGMNPTYLYCYATQDKQKTDSIPLSSFIDMKTLNGYNFNLLFSHDTLYAVFIKIFQHEKNGKTTHLIFCFDRDLKLLEKHSFYGNTFSGNIRITEIRKTTNGFYYGKSQQHYYIRLSKNNSAIYNEGWFDYSNLTHLPDTMRFFLRKQVVKRLDSTESTYFDGNLIYDYIIYAQKMWFYVANINGEYELYVWNSSSDKICKLHSWRAGYLNPAFVSSLRSTDKGFYWMENKKGICYLSIQR